MDRGNTYYSSISELSSSSLLKSVLVDLLFMRGAVLKGLLLMKRSNRAFIESTAVFSLRDK